MICWKLLLCRAFHSSKLQLISSSPSSLWLKQRLVITSGYGSKKRPCPASTKLCKCCVYTDEIVKISCCSMFYIYCDLVSGEYASQVWKQGWNNNKYHKTISLISSYYEISVISLYLLLPLKINSLLCIVGIHFTFDVKQ